MILAIFYGTHTVSAGKNMNDIESLRDYLIADEIQRVRLLSREELMRELISIQSSSIERMSESELIAKCNAHA